MTKREVIRSVLDGHAPPYTPWSFGFTKEAAEKLALHYGTHDLDGAVGNHILGLGSAVGFFDDLGGDRFRDVFGVVWDRTVDKDIGNVANCVLPEPTLEGYDFPDPVDARIFRDIPGRIERCPDRYRLYCIGFSLYERAWTLRGMTTLLMDFYDNPGFVAGLLDAVCDYNIAQVRRALTYDVDAVYFGDDWGQQRGLQMGYPLWKRFLYPVLARMYGAVKEAGKRVVIHSCGDVDELFDDLIEIGVDCFNPFQPEVMDTGALHEKYLAKPRPSGQAGPSKEPDLRPRPSGQAGPSKEPDLRLAFWGGLSTQRTLPYGTVRQVREETERLIAMGRRGGLILAPAHSVEGDVPLENMLAFIDAAKAQPGYAG